MLPNYELPSRQKKSKKTQKDTVRQSRSIAPPAYEIASVHTSPIEQYNYIPDSVKISGFRRKKVKRVIFNDCRCDDDTIIHANQLGNLETWKSTNKQYGDNNTTDVWMVPENRNRKAYSRGHKKEYLENLKVLNDDDVKYNKDTKTPNKKPKIHKKQDRAKQKHNSKENQREKSVSVNVDSRDKTSIISLFRINHKQKQKDLGKNIKSENAQKIISGSGEPADQGMKSKRKSSPRPKNISDIIKQEHDGEQTGAPFFEIQVNQRNMCVLNPADIKENILKYGKPEKKEPKCICPSRGRLRAGEVCKSGVCKKAFKNKQTNFNCWCDKQIAECSDTTCGLNHFLSNKRRRQKYDKSVTIKKLNKPLLEVQLDMDKMCIVNPKEIEDKIINNITADEVCSSGLCRDAALKRKGQFHCKCVSRKINSDITECDEDTCIDKNQKQKSRFCLFCTRICSKSENWTTGYRSRNQKKIKRRSFYEIGSNKLGRGNIFTKSEHLHGNNGVHLNYPQPQTLQENTRDLKSMKNDIKSLTLENEVTDKTNTDKLRLNKMEKRHFNNLKQNYIPETFQEKPMEVTCTCAHTCECHKDYNETEIRSTKKNEKLQRKKLAQKRRNKIIEQHNFDKDTRRRAKLDRKREKLAAKARLKEIKMMQKKMNEEPLDTNVCTAFLLGVLKIGVKATFFIFYIIFLIIKDPRGSWLYVRDRIMNPEGTFNKLKKWFSDAIVIKKLEISETVRGSDTLNILADHFQDTPFYQTFAQKGHTKKEQMVFEQKSKARRRRIRKREQQAIHSCRHMLLTTLRRTPCLWVYHICPNFYPQCLSLLSFMRSFSHILMFLVAFACWTPCILSFELCRAFLCCFMCTN